MHKSGDSWLSSHSLVFLKFGLVFEGRVQLDDVIDFLNVYRFRIL